MAEIALDLIKVGPRIRKDLGDIQGLADSISRIGLIQPVIIDRENNLIAGERRYRAMELLKWTATPFLYKDSLSEDERSEIEFEENFWRKAFSWQEEALGILSIYRKKRLKGTLEGWKGSYQQIVADMFSMSIGNVNYILMVAKKLELEKDLPSDQRKYWNFQSAAEAYRMGILGEEQDRLNRELASRQKPSTTTPTQQTVHVEELAFIEKTTAEPDLLASERARYKSNPLNVVPFEEYWKGRQAMAQEQQNTVYLSNRFHCGDCIPFMLDPDNAHRFDHILTDPPYAIDIEYLNQNNPHNGIQDLDRLRDQHQQADNVDLLKRFWPAAWQCTRDNAFVITWCDQMVWQFMHDCAIDAGFAVQRWPYIWRKVNQSVMNQCAGYNTTKDYEIAMIARKPGATLYAKKNTSVKEASNVQVTKETGHPFAKPYETTLDLLDTISIKGQSILDPFMGGGSIVIAALRAERNAFGCELPEAQAPWFNQAMTNIKMYHYLKVNPNAVFK